MFINTGAVSEMQAVEVSSLTVGTITRHEYFSDQGELLISKGVAITEEHLWAIRRRHIKTVYLSEDEKRSEIEELLHKAFQEIDDLDLDDTPPQVPDTAFSLPEELRHIKPGSEGLDQLIESTPVRKIEQSLSRGFTQDTPAGTPLKARMSQLPPGSRSSEYKRSISRMYAQSLEEVSRLLTGLLEGGGIDFTALRGVFSQFLAVLLTDRNLLINLAYTRTSAHDYLFSHTLNTCLLAVNIAAEAGYNENQIIEIGVGALLQDIGMFLIPRSILAKKDRLTPDEWFEVQKHPILGLHVLEKIRRLPDSVPIIAYQAHERENGRGYPRRRPGRLIHQFAKIVQIADIFEAFTAPRNYRTALTPYQAMERLIKMARHGLVSGDVVRTFLTCTSLFPIGSFVELSDRRIGRVVAANGRSYTKPVVSIVAEEGRVLPEERIYPLNLKKETVHVVKSHHLNIITDVDPLHGF